MTPEEAAKRTAALFYADLDVEIDPNALVAFIKRRWARIAPMAHIMHEAPDFTKRDSVGQPDVALEHKSDMPVPGTNVYLNPAQNRVWERIMSAFNQERPEEIRVTIARILAETGI